MCVIQNQLAALLSCIIWSQSVTPPFLSGSREQRRQHHPPRSLSTTPSFIPHRRAGWVATHGVTKKYRRSAVSYVGNAVQAISVRVGTLRQTEKKTKKKTKTKRGAHLSADPVLENTPITHSVRLSTALLGRRWQRRERNWTEGQSEGRQRTGAQSRSRGSENGRPDPGSEEPPRLLSAGVLSAFSGGPLFTSKAARAQSGGTERPLLEVEEPLCLNGALPADWNMGRGVVSVHPNICPCTLGHHCPFTAHMMCCAWCWWCLCVFVSVAVTVCGSQEKKGMLRQGEGRGRQRYL